MPIKQRGNLWTASCRLSKPKKASIYLVVKVSTMALSSRSSLTALSCMNDEIEDNMTANRKVKLGKVVQFRGMVSSFIRVPAR